MQLHKHQHVILTMPIFGTVHGEVLEIATPGGPPDPNSSPRIARILQALSIIDELHIEQVALIERFQGTSFIALYNSARGWIDLQRQHLTITPAQTSKGASS